MAYTAFKAGDRVSWDGIKAMVVEDSNSERDEVKVYVDGRVENWAKVYTFQDESITPIPVILESVDGA